MTQQEKELLLKDLCGRSPYGVKVAYLATTYNIQYVDVKFDEVKLEGMSHTIDISYVKPYLRSLSSMTEEENTRATASYEYNKLTYGLDYAITAYVDYLYSIHIDCHNLIPRGLALLAPEGMYN